MRDSPEGPVQQRERRLRALAEVLAQSGHGRPASAVEAAYERCGLEMSERAWSAHR